MKETFLHYIWQTQYFDKSKLITTGGEQLQIYFPGSYNLDSGPDFQQGRIGIGEEELFGHIEIHIHSSDWYAHRHETDLAYQPVILHVVWEHNREVIRMDGSLIPTLELRSRINPGLLDRSKAFFDTLDNLICGRSLHTVPEDTLRSMAVGALENRLLRISGSILDIHKARGHDWYETLYAFMIRSFGFRINTYAFERISEVLPFRVLRKHIHELFQLESLLFGMAGFLKGSGKDDYYRLLKKEFIFLKHKYQLGESLALSEWKFSRTRPSNFPPLRIAQFAKLIHKKQDLFNSFMRSDLKQLVRILKVNPSDYWKNHYKFGKRVSEKVPGLGMGSIRGLIINTVLPFKYCLGLYTNDPIEMSAAVKLMEQLPPEDNSVIQLWSSYRIKARNSMETQGLYALYKDYCRPNHCLQCKVGSYIFKN